MVLYAKVLKPVVELLRSQGMHLNVLMNQCPQVVMHQLQIAVDLLESLGLMINKQKLLLTPAQCIMFLTFITDFRESTLSLPTKKRTMIRHVLRKTLSRETASLRQFNLLRTPRPDPAGDHRHQALPAGADVRRPRTSPHIRGAQSPGTPLHRRPLYHKTPGPLHSKGRAAKDAPDDRHQARATPPPLPRAEQAPLSLVRSQQQGRTRPRAARGTGLSGALRPDKTAHPEARTTHLSPAGAKEHPPWMPAATQGSPRRPGVPLHAGPTPTGPASASRPKGSSAVGAPTPTEAPVPARNLPAGGSAIHAAPSGEMSKSALSPAEPHSVTAILPAS
ncbi:hypothetical protein NDU88_003991 [Pleurodeles waltl]|uniref:Uncharacterized protein n=1 Tax=Pleurodeles waltl TaxID=8319 RepID=A0AAV7W3P9_PLEWA|nr:hypothetical protein NDU88_003991 [Pleurodeles waltl]